MVKGATWTLDRRAGPGPQAMRYRPWGRATTPQGSNVAGSLFLHAPSSESEASPYSPRGLPSVPAQNT